MLGMYVHTHWAYRHPYAARTWRLADWRNYLTGLHELGYDMAMVWPQMDAMPPTPNASDRAYLATLHDAIDLAQTRFGMKVALAVAPNCIGNELAGRYAFEDRPYFVCERKIDPADPGQVRFFLEARRRQIEPIANADAIAVIDGDPGGYPGSANRDFVRLVRGQLDAFRSHHPGGEFIYWMLAGWGSYCRFWQEQMERESPRPDMWDGWRGEDFDETLRLMREALEEPWSVYAWREAHGAALDRLGLRDKAMYYPYGAVEGEPVFPLCSCDPSRVAAQLDPRELARHPRGIMANAQNHCLQVPNTCVFAHLARGGAPGDLHLAPFADDLVPGHGPRIAAAWQCLKEAAPDARRAAAESLRRAAGGRFRPGRLSGLLFGDPDRFFIDLAMNLELLAALDDFGSALEAGRGATEALAAVLEVLLPYQERVGYVDAYGGALHTLLNERLRRLGDSRLNAVLRDFEDWRDPAVRNYIVPRLLAAMCQAAGVRTGGTVR